MKRIAFRHSSIYFPTSQAILHIFQLIVIGSPSSNNEYKETVSHLSLLQNIVSTRWVPTIEMRPRGNSAILVCKHSFDGWCTMKNNKRSSRIEKINEKCITIWEGGWWGAWGVVMGKHSIVDQLWIWNIGCWVLIFVLDITGNIINYSRMGMRICYLFGGFVPLSFAIFWWHEKKKWVERNCIQQSA